MNEDGKDEESGELSSTVIRTLAEVHDGFRQFVRRALRSDADADDVMQQFYVRVVLHASDVRQEESVRSWLRRVLGSALTDHLRRQAARRRAEADFARKEAATPPPENDLDRTVCLCLKKLLPTLKPEYAEVLRRSELEGEPREVIAAALGLTMGNLTVRLHRARKALRRALELTCETCPIHGYLDCGCTYSRHLRTGLSAGEKTSRSRGV